MHHYIPWQERARCRDYDPEVFFPEKGGSSREAKRICCRVPRSDRVPQLRASPRRAVRRVGRDERTGTTAPQTDGVVRSRTLRDPRRKGGREWQQGRQPHGRRPAREEVRGSEEVRGDPEEDDRRSKSAAGKKAAATRKRTTARSKTAAKKAAATQEDGRRGASRPRSQAGREAAKKTAARKPARRKSTAKKSAARKPASERRRPPLASRPRKKPRPARSRRSQAGSRGRAQPRSADAELIASRRGAETPPFPFPGMPAARLPAAPRRSTG